MAREQRKEHDQHNISLGWQPARGDHQGHKVLREGTLLLRQEIQQRNHHCKKTASNPFSVGTSMWEPK